MKRLKKILLWTFGVLFGLIALLALLGYIFEDKIHLMAIKELEKALNADIEVRETSVSFLRSWPQVQVRLKDLTINPHKHADAQNVIAVEDAIFNIGFWSIFTDHYKIQGVRLVKPEFRLTVDRKGNLNFGDMFVVPDDTADTSHSTGPNPVFELYAVRIEDGHFIYSDRRDGSLVDIDSIQLGMRGDFSAERSDIDTKFAIHLADWKSGRATWARNKHLSAEIVADVSFGEHESYKLKTATIDIAALKLAFEGGIGREGAVFDLDLQFASSKNTFESFLSLLPGGLLDTGRDYEYDGEFVTKGWIKGKAGGGFSPDIHADFFVSNGAFHYVGYESRLSAVNLDGEFHYEEKDASASHLSLKNFKATLHEKGLSGHMNYANFKDPRLAVALKGEVSLKDIRDFYPAFADSTDMSGLVQVDAQVEGRIADFENKNHGAIKAFGGFKLKSLRISDPRLQLPIEQLSGEILLDNYRIEVASLSGKIGKSDFAVKGIVTEYLPWLLDENAQLKGSAELRCANLDLDEWFASSPAATTSESSNGGAEENFTFKLPKDMDIELVAQIGKFSFSKFEATAMNGGCRLANQTLSISNLQMNTLGGTAEVNGSFKVLDEKHCQVKIDGLIKNVDVNKTFKTFEQLAAFALVKDNLYGIFSGDVHLAGNVDQDLELDTKTFVSFGNVNIRECKLINFEPLEGLVGFVKLEDLQHIEFSDITTDFRISEENFYIPKMSLKANRYSMDVVGKHGFDNTLDYKVYVELPRKEAKKSKNKQVLDMVEVNQGDPIKIILPVHISGTVDKPKYGLEGQYVAEKLDEQVKKEGEELKQAWQTEMEETWGVKKDSTKVDDLIDVDYTAKDTNRLNGKAVMDKVKKPLDKLKKPIKSIGDRLSK